jgi:protein-disulfide isomerase
MNGLTDRLGGWVLPLYGLVCAIAGGIGGWAWSASLPMGRAGIERVVHNYLLEHPEVLPEAMDNLRKQEARKALAGIRREVEQPFPGAVLGNPNGKVTLVEFSDFACTYCRQSVAEIAALVKANPDLKVVIRQLPILSPVSADAARMGLAAAAQGKFAAFHDALFQGGRLDGATIQAAARVAGLDVERAKRDSQSPEIEAEIEQNVEFARTLGFQGTPSWVIGDEIHAGAVGQETLSKAISKARS